MREKNDIDWVSVALVRGSEVRLDEPGDELIDGFDEVSFGLIRGVNDGFESMRAGIRFGEDRRYACGIVGEAVRSIQSAQRATWRTAGELTCGRRL